MKRSSIRTRAVPAAFAVPVGATALLVVAAASAALSGRLPTSAVVALCACVVGVVSAMSERGAGAPMAVVGWMAAASFASRPYGQLRAGTGVSAEAAAAVAGAAIVGTVTGVCWRGLARRPGETTLGDVHRIGSAVTGLNQRRQLAGVVIATVGLPVLTLLLTAMRQQVSLADDLLIYLCLVVAVAVVGGFWPAILAAVAASLLLNWFFTEPVHTFTIAKPDNLLALLLFVVVATAVSSVVHLSARRALAAARSNAEAESLLALARTVLAGEDTPRAVLAHLHTRLGLSSELVERRGGQWRRVAAAGDVGAPVDREIDVRSDLRLLVHGLSADSSSRVIEAAASQAAAAMDRDRLRTQAQQAEALAAGNRMRTALLAAVSHDLRTPLASAKAAISSLRQTDVEWSDTDRDDLLATIEESTDRLTGLIANLLDMSRLQSGAVQPYLHEVALDEVALLALRGLEDIQQVSVSVPEDLPLVRTDGGLLERVLANLLSNALRHSPADEPVELAAREEGGRVVINVTDHGPGVDAGDRERMFAPFQRLGDNDTTTGVGLGLAVARGLTESLGGTLVATATPGGGLTMTVTLPPAATSNAVVKR